MGGLKAAAAVAASDAHITSLVLLWWLVAACNEALNTCMHPNSLESWGVASSSTKHTAVTRLLLLLLLIVSV